MTEIRRAAGKDVARVKAFAAGSGVSTEGLRGPLDRFYLMENDEGRLLTVAGMDTLEEGGLLRALVINPEACEMDDVVRFFSAMVSEAERLGLRALFLRTPSPEVFEALGFAKLDTDRIPEPIRELSEVHGDAVVMSRELSTKH